jgi:hypothetical protein
MPATSLLCLAQNSSGTGSYGLALVHRLHGSGRVYEAHGVLAFAYRPLGSLAISLDVPIAKPGNISNGTLFINGIDSTPFLLLDNSSRVEGIDRKI